MAEVKRDDNVVVERSSINVAGIIAAIALLLAVWGVLHYFGVL